MELWIEWWYQVQQLRQAFIFGHSCQAVSLIVRAASSFLAVPLACRIHEGIVFSNRDKRSLLDKLVLLVLSLGIVLPFYLVADRSSNCTVYGSRSRSASSRPSTRWAPMPTISG